MHNHRAAVMRAAALGAGLALVGCSALPGGSATGSRSATADAAAPAGGCRPPAALTWTDGSLPDGSQFGWVRHFDGQAIYLDPADYFSNEDAVRAAREDGQIGEGEDLPNPFYIRDPAPDVVRLLVSAGFTLTVIDAATHPAERTLTPTELATIYCGEADTAWMYALPDNLPARVRIAAGHADGATEQYLP